MAGGVDGDVRLGAGREATSWLAASNSQVIAELQAALT